MATGEGGPLGGLCKEWFVALGSKHGNSALIVREQLFWNLEHIFLRIWWGVTEDQACPQKPT